MYYSFAHLAIFVNKKRYVSGSDFRHKMPTGRSSIGVVCMNTVYCTSDVGLLSLAVRLALFLRRVALPGHRQGRHVSSSTTGQVWISEHFSEI